MKASKASIGRSVDQPDAKTRFYLLYGPDDSQSRALGARLVTGLGATKLALAPGAIKADPGMLAAEASAMSLFGEKQAIWIEAAGDDIGPGVELLLQSPAAELPVIAIGGALRKSSALLKLAEASPAALAFASYVPEGQDAVRMVADLGRTLGLKISTSVAARIADNCSGDQAIVSQELQKLALYIDASPHTPKELDHEAALSTRHGQDEVRFLEHLLRHAASLDRIGLNAVVPEQRRHGFGDWMADQRMRARRADVHCWAQFVGQQALHRWRAADITCANGQY